MRIKGRFGRVTLCLSGILLLSCLGFRASQAQEASRDSDSELKEQSIYIPYDKLREVFEKEGRGVFLPYEKFRKLWREARERRKDPVPDDPPVDHLINEVIGEATVSRDVVFFKATVKVEVLKDGWHEITLDLKDVAVTQASLGDGPAHLRFDPLKGYILVLEKRGKGSRIFDLKLSFAKAYDKNPGQNSVSFATPAAPVSRWDVWIPEPGVEVRIHPLLAATEEPEAAKKSKTHILAFVGAAPSVRIEWTPKAEGATGLEALVSVQAEQQVFLEEGISRTKVALDYDIRRAAIPRLEVQVPPGQKVVNVYDPNVREWSVTETEGTQKISVHLFEAAKGAQKLLVELEKFFEGELHDVKVPVVKALDVGRQQGVIVARVGEGLRAEASEKKGLLQVDNSELPSSLKRQPWAFAYRYASVPFELTLQVEKIRPRILAESLGEIHLEPESLELRLLTIFDVQKAGAFRLELSLPGDFEMRKVRGVAAGEAKALHIENRHLQGEDEKRLVVNLGRKALGKVAMEVVLQRPLSEPDLMKPTGRPAVLPFSMPRVLNVEREKGALVVYARESLRVSPEGVRGLRSIAHDEAVRNLPSTRKEGERPVLAYAYGEEEAALNLAAERRTPHVTVRQLLVGRIESGVARFSASFFYDILYSGLEHLRIDIPEGLVDAKIRITTKGLERQAVPPGQLTEEIPAGYVPWRITAGTEFMGAYRIDMQWEERIDKLATGIPFELAVPRLIPRQVDRAWGQIVLTKAETLDVSPSGDGESLRPIDPQQDLMQGANVPDAARAFEFHDDWSLTMKVTRYDLEEVKATSIERALVRMVVTKGDTTSVQAIYRMRSARQRLSISLPQGVTFDRQPARINGQAVTLERGEDVYHVPLTGQSPDGLFLLEIRYLLQGRSLTLAPPSFPEEPAVQKVFFSVYLPKHRDYLGYRGPWNDEMHWSVRGFTAAPRPRYPADWLIGHVAEGMAVDLKGLKNFQTDGRHLLFSSLRPPSGEAGRIRIYALPQWLLKGFVLVVVLGGGLLLLKAGASSRMASTGLAVIALLVLSIFFPTMTIQLVDNTLVAACLIVLVAWLLWYFLVTRPAKWKVPPPVPLTGTEERGEGGGVSHE